MGENLGGIGGLDGLGDFVGGWNGRSGWNEKNGPRVGTWCVSGQRWAWGSIRVEYQEVEVVDLWVW